MPDRYPHFWGGSQICGQSAPPVKGTNGEKLKMLNCKFACISDPAANTMQTAVSDNFLLFVPVFEWIAMHQGDLPPCSSSAATLHLVWSQDSRS